MSKIYQRLGVEDILVPKGTTVKKVYAILKDGEKYDLDRFHVDFEDEDGNEIFEESNHD
jgi:hypothetical protein